MSTDAFLHLAALARAYAGPLDPTDRQLLDANDRAYRADTARVSPERIRELNTLAQDYFTGAYPTSWAPAYLRDRFGVDPAQTGHAHPGYAPAGWTALVTQLRRHGATDTEILDAGLATTTRTGRVIDRFRDRVTFPIVHTGHILGFVARRNPALDQAGDGPKYLNTADTVLFHKGAQLYGVDPHLLAEGARPVLVEGPMDALAVTLAGRGRYLGVAPLGTALTEDQAAQLAALSASPLVATDADPAGRVAAHRAYWLLTQHGLTPHAVTLPDGADPADLLAHEDSPALREALDHPRALSDVVLDEHLAGRTGLRALRGAAAVVAAADPQTWDHAISRVADTLAIPADRVRRELADAVRAWDNDPRPVAAHLLATLTSARTRRDVTPADPSTPPRRDMELATPRGRSHNPELARLGDRVEQATLTPSPGR